MQRIYLDSNATTPMRPEVVAAMIPVFSEDYGIPRPSTGRPAGEGDARRCASAGGTSSFTPKLSEIIFLSGGTEADNLAIRGIVESQKSKGRHIITSKIEHHAVLHTCKDMRSKAMKSAGLASHLRPGRPRRRAAGDTADTILISVMHANNEIGTIQPI